MDIKIKVSENKQVYPNDIVIGSVGEKNVDSILADVPNMPKAKWFLYVANDHQVIPFVRNRINIDERLTHDSSAKIVRIIGTDAKSGEDIKNGTMCFVSEKIILRVKEW